MVTVGIIGARMNSSRLYGKPMQYIQGKHLIGHIVERIGSIPGVEKVIIATTSGEDNNPIVKYARDNGIDCFVDNRDEEDVLGRFVRAVEWLESGGHEITNVIRATGECPLHYVENMEELLNMHESGRYDFSYTALLPLGSFLEIIRANALKRSYIEYGEKYKDPRVTLAISDHRDDFRILRIEPRKDLQRPNMRLTVDTPEDLIVIREVYKNLYKKGIIIKISDAIKFLDEHPEISKINGGIPMGNMARIWY